METRAVHSSTIKRSQVFQNRVVLGSTAVRRRDLHNLKFILSDLRQQLGLVWVEVTIGVRQLRWVGHVLRMPTHRLEQQMLHSWLVPERSFPRKPGPPNPTIRSQYMRRIRELRQFTGFDAKQWVDEWQKLALDKRRWEGLVRRWRKMKKKEDKLQMWTEKHKEGSWWNRKMIAREIRKVEVAKAEKVAVPLHRVSQEPCPSKAKAVAVQLPVCPHCSGQFPSTALASHVSTCATLPTEQRAIGAKCRQQRAARILSSVSGVSQKVRALPSSSSVLRRPSSSGASSSTALAAPASTLQGASSSAPASRKKVMDISALPVPPPTLHLEMPPQKTP